MRPCPGVIAHYCITSRGTLKNLIVLLCGPEDWLDCWLEKRFFGFKQKILIKGSTIGEKSSGPFVTSQWVAELLGTACKQVATPVSSRE
jgi:hypothetical protein